ncbi:MAG: protein kinase [Thermoanaerobaculia bacterium]
MSLSPGTRFGPYEILAPLGAGGMGEVYRARDPRLGREVAIKILPAELSADRDRLTRFDQEARSASALNHPNIVTIYEIGRAGETSYIAMELVAGKTLREILAESPIPVRRLLPIASQIAEGLARAHETGIVHRDLKPENVMVTRDGHVKILDFGLAKLVPHAGSDASQLATAIEPTRPGIVLGTVGYMSPEQASGHPLDFRSDQFSLGSIVYEMAAGRRAFSRGTAAETLAAIIRDEPESLQSLSSQVPVALRWVTERCLGKDPQERYASTRDLARDLAHLRDHVSEVSAEAAAVVRPRRRRVLVPALGAGLIVAAAALITFAALRRRDAPVLDPVRFAVPIPPGATYAPPPETSRGVSVSPDGTRLGIEAFSRGRRRLFVRPLASDDAVELEGSADATAHFWSPDSSSIAFFAEGKLKKIPASGGPPVTLCDAPLSVVGTWNREGTILFSRLDPPGIFRVPDSGGEPVRVTVGDDSKGQNHLWPQFLPDGRRFLYLVNNKSGLGIREVIVASLDSKESRSLMRLHSRTEYVAPGFLLYVRDGALFAQRFDERAARLQGEPRLLTSDVHYHFGPGHGTFSASQTGVLAYQTAARPSRLVWFDRQGKEIGQVGQPAVVKGLRISPDGARVAVDIADRRTGTSDVWLFELAPGVSTRLHSDSADEILPVWSADASKLFYRSDREGPPDIYEMTIEVPGSEKPLLQEPSLQQPEDVSRDGRVLAYVYEIQTAVWNIKLLPLEGERKSASWVPTRFSQTSPRFSPDGRWIAYESDESGDPEVYVALAQGGGEKRRISPGGGRRPRWRRDGKELYYVAPGGSIMAVSVAPGAQWSAGAPAVLFRVDSEIQNWDVAPDGARFLLSTPSERFQESPLRVILNWPSLLKGEK